MTNLDSILISRDITLPTKVRLVKAMVFPVVMDGCESWTVRKPESQRTDASELWCWRILLRAPWTARRSNQSILKEITHEYSLEGLMLKLKLTDSWAKGFPGGASGEEPSCQSRRHKRYRFDPWVRKIPWRRACQPTPVFLPGESQGQRNLVGYNPWGSKVGHD